MVQLIKDGRKNRGDIRWLLFEKTFTASSLKVPPERQTSRSQAGRSRSEGYFMGIVWRTSESRIATKVGAYTTSAARRARGHRRWNGEGLLQIKGAPRDHPQFQNWVPFLEKPLFGGVDDLTTIKRDWERRKEGLEDRWKRSS